MMFVAEHNQASFNDGRVFHNLINCVTLKQFANRFQSCLI